MGSTGSGSFTDYSDRKPSSENADDGGSSGKDPCGQAFNTSLEEVSRCSYLINNGIVPPRGTSVRVRFNGIRLSVETEIGEEIGFLPTKYNYIKVCMDSGLNYVGSVNSSSLVPTPAVFVDIVPI